MNLLIHTLENTPKGFFFDSNGIVYKEIIFPSSSGFIDILSKENYFTDTYSIFYVSGPASFTSLRNLSVFLRILLKFSKNKYSIYSISTNDILLTLFPEKGKIALGIGKRESFIFSKNTPYKKIKNEISLDIFKVNFDKINFSTIFFSTLLKNKNKYIKNNITIEYGANPIIENTF